MIKLREVPAAMDMPPELRALWEQAVRIHDRDTDMWAAVKRDLTVTDFAKVSWLQIYDSKQKCCYTLRPHEIEALHNAGRLK